MRPRKRLVEEVGRHGGREIKKIGIGDDDRPSGSSGRSSSTSKARATRPRPTTSATEVIGGALPPKLTERGLIEPEGFPLMRHLRAVVAND